MAQTQDAAAPYEHVFRMWGRHVQYSTFRATGNDEVAQRADAIKIADRQFSANEVSRVHHGHFVRSLAPHGGMK